MKSKYFKTSDGTEFFTENDAKNHAKTLKDKTVIPPSGNDEASDNTEAKTEGLKEALAAFDPEAADAYETGKQLVKTFGLTKASNKKEDILQAIADAKAKTEESKTED